MSQEQITEMLNRLSDLQAHIDVINIKFDELKDSVLTPEIKAELEDIEAERQTSLDSLQTGVSELTAEIKTAVINTGSTVKAEHLQAVFMKGRTSWNTKALAGYAIANPEIEQFKKVGNPSVSIRIKK